MPEYKLPEYKLAVVLEVSFEGWVPNPEKFGGESITAEKGKTSQYILVDLPPGIQAHEVRSLVIKIKKAGIIQMMGTDLGSGALRFVAEGEG
jgi:hypothetical protein